MPKPNKGTSKYVFFDCFHTSCTPNPLKKFWNEQSRIFIDYIYIYIYLSIYILWLNAWVEGKKNFNSTVAPVPPASCWSVRGSSQVCPATQTGPGPLTGHTVKLSQNVTVAQQIYQASHDWASSQHRSCAPQNSSKAFSQCFHQGQNNNRTKKAMRPRWTDGQACAWSLDSAWLAAAAQWACKRTLERYFAHGKLPDCRESASCVGATLDKSKSSDNCARARTFSTVASSFDMRR